MRKTLFTFTVAVARTLSRVSNNFFRICVSGKHGRADRENASG